MNKIIFFLIVIALCSGVFLFIGISLTGNTYSAALYSKNGTSSAVMIPVKPLPPKHLPTPKPLRALYMSAWTAGAPVYRDRLINIANETEINAVVIDVKDSTGAVSFEIDDPVLRGVDPFKNRISDVRGLIDALHDKGIYAIARIAVFEDPILATARPDLAVKRASDGATWKDRKGLAWTDMGSKEVWDYNIAVAKGAYLAGFDEINFDYIRFPSDGDMSDIAYPSLVGKKFVKAEELKAFFKYLGEQMDTVGAPISADLFGMTTTNTDDLNIGQVLENAIPYFDYVSPMVYPSHYPNNFHGYANPAEHPYDLIKFVMGEGVRKVVAASSTPDKLRPWLQDFDLGAVYTAEMVRAEIKATYDVGLDSWMLWDPANKYTIDALEKI